MFKASDGWPRYISLKPFEPLQNFANVSSHSKVAEYNSSLSISSGFISGAKMASDFGSFETDKVANIRSPGFML